MQTGTRNSTEPSGDDLAELPDIRLNRRTKVCIWIIVLGLGNFLAYSVAYFSLRGEAVHGVVKADADATRHYYLVDKRFHLIEVSKAVWIYSAAHSTSIPITVGAVLLAMLTVAKDRIISSLRSSAVRGRAFITGLAVIVTVSSLVWMAWFLYLIVSKLRDPAPLIL